MLIDVVGMCSLNAYKCSLNAYSCSLSAYRGCLSACRRISVIEFFCPPMLEFLQVYLEFLWA